MTQEDTQPYAAAPSGHGMYSVHRRATDGSGRIVQTVITLRSKKTIERVADALNMAWADGRAATRD